MQYFVYLMASRKNGTLYVGVTNNLVRRAYEHKNGLVEGFTDRYGVHQLVWFESTRSGMTAFLAGQGPAHLSTLAHLSSRT